MGGSHMPWEDLTQTHPHLDCNFPARKAYLGSGIEAPSASELRT